jgi:hypothetical protein
MPFQSEKQRRYLHANHPEIAKRWERDYANGGISNHFRKKFDQGSDYGQFERRQAHNVAAGQEAMNVGGGQGNQGGGGDHHPPVYMGPTAEEIAADEARLQALEDARRNQIYEDRRSRRKKKKEKVDWVDKTLDTADTAFKVKSITQWADGTPISPEELTEDVPF